MALIFISNVVPDTEHYRNAAFTRSGNNVLTGICDALPAEEDAVILSCRPVPSFPKGKLWYGKETVCLNSGKKVTLLPTFNLKIIKNIFWGLCCFLYILRRGLGKHKKGNKVLVYNIYTPPISFLYRACRVTRIPLYAILYDLGVPPRHLGLGWLTMLGYRMMEKIAKRYIPLLDGRIVINENIVEHYAPDKDYILIDGGVSAHVLDNLFPLKESRSGKYVLLCAGLLWEQNGTRLILDTLEKYKDLDIMVYFAGVGNDVPLIEEKSRSDSRIRYFGMLDMKHLFQLYEEADILLNLRIEEELDFHFPSKLIEYMATGKHVLSTPVAHAQRDYGKYISVLDEITPNGLAEKIAELTRMGKHDLYLRGRQTRDFILTQRLWESRVREMIGYMNGN